MAHFSVNLCFLLLALVGSCWAQEPSIARYAFKNRRVEEAQPHDAVAGSFIEGATELKDLSSLSSSSSSKSSTVANLTLSPSPAPGVNVGVKVDVNVAQHQPQPLTTLSGSGKGTVLVSGGKLTGNEVLQLGYRLGEEGFKLIVGSMYGIPGAVAAAFKITNPSGELTYVYCIEPSGLIPRQGPLIHAIQAKDKEAQWAALIPSAQYHVVLPGGDGTINEMEAAAAANKQMPTVCLITQDDLDGKVAKKCEERQIKVVSTADDAVQSLLSS